MSTRKAANWSITILLAAVTVLAAAQRGQPSEAPRKVPLAKTVPVGVAKIDITPQGPVRMYGYGARKTESEGVAGRLCATALAIGGDGEGGPAVLLAVDNGAVPSKLRSEVFKRINLKVKVKPERFVLCNAHNHSGPDIKGVGSMSGEHREHILRYTRKLTDWLEQVVLEALASRKPGRLAWTQGKVGFAANRRVLKDGKWSGFGAVPGAAVDHSLPVLRVTDRNGKLLALMVNYACHCTTLRGNFKKIHGDWAGAAQEFIEADHPGCKALISIGCGADADPYPHGTVKLAQQHGRAIAEEVKRLLKGPLLPIDPRLTARMATISLPYQKPPPPDELKQRAKSSWSLQDVLKRIERGEKLPTVQYAITTWTFGDDLAMVFLRGEVVVDYALRMKREMDSARLWITAYANDVPCYITSKRLLGEGGYEVRNSLSSRVSYGRPEQVVPAMEDRIIDKVRELLPADFASPPVK